LTQHNGGDTPQDIKSVLRNCTTPRSHHCTSVQLSIPALLSCTHNTTPRSHHCTSVQLSVPALLRCTQNITSISLLNMSCTVHLQQCRLQ